MNGKVTSREEIVRTYPTPRRGPFGHESSIGWCVLGLGRIACEHFIPGLALSRTGYLSGVVSADSRKALALAHAHGLSEQSVYDYDNFDAIHTNPAIQAVYVSLPTRMHSSFAVRAAKAGKHVLCEKPMASSVEGAVRMCDACRIANVKLMIAYRCQYDPVVIQAVQRIRNGSIGEVIAIESEFGVAVSQADWRLDPSLAGGGALMDLGIYPLSLMREIIDQNPNSIRSFASYPRPHIEAALEGTMTWQMRYPSGAMATCRATYEADVLGYIHIRGTTGVAELSPAFNYEGIRFTERVRNHCPLVVVTADRDPTQFAREVDHMAYCIKTGVEPKTAGTVGVKDIQLITDIYAAGGIALPLQE